ncbi:MAG: type II toxin-antitoxin system VapC family toxin [Saprospiraceae bacterium]|nr:type II toxin-antitoxin system VapC family toxin [Saprospiraceae bacterium]
MRSVVIDTNIYSALCLGDPDVTKAIEIATTVIVPVFVLAEILFGFKKGSREGWNRANLQTFLKLPGVNVRHTTSETAEIFSEITLTLRNIGKPIPTNDIWIAAITVETGSVLMTRDHHFDFISKIRLWK